MFLKESMFTIKKIFLLSALATSSEAHLSASNHTGTAEHFYALESETSLKTPDSSSGASTSTSTGISIYVGEREMKQPRKSGCLLPTDGFDDPLD